MWITINVLFSLTLSNTLFSIASLHYLYAMCLLGFCRYVCHLTSLLPLSPMVFVRVMLTLYTLKCILRVTTELPDRQVNMAKRGIKVNGVVEANE